MTSKRFALSFAAFSLLTLGNGGRSFAEDEPSPRPLYNLVWLAGRADYLFVESTSDACSGRDDRYACFYEDGSGQFFGDPADRVGSNAVESGLRPAGARMLLSYQRLLSERYPLALGLTGGIAFGGPTSTDHEPLSNLTAHDPPETVDSMFTLHAALRATYFLGGPPLLSGSFRPYVFIGGGFAQVNAESPAIVCDKANRDGSPVIEGSGDCDVTLPNGFPVATVERDDLLAYKIAGNTFVGAGAGVVYGITHGVGIAAEIEVMTMFPARGIVIAPTLGPVFGF